jgi:hypothetical protein
MGYWITRILRKAISDRFLVRGQKNLLLSKGAEKALGSAMGI